MTVRVGINGFGRIGRNFFRAAKQPGADIDFVAVNDLGSLDDDGPPAQVRLGPRRPRRTTSRSPTTASRSTATRSRSSPSATRRSCRGATSASTSSSSRPASSPTATRPPPTSTAGAPLVIVSAPATGADATFVVGVNDDDLRPGQAQGRLQRLVHDELLRADGQGARRRLRRREGPDDHGPRLHRRPDAASTARTTTCAGPGPRPSTSCPTSTGAARATGLVLESMKGKLDGTVAAGAGARRLDHRLHRHPEARTSRSTRSTPRSRRPRQSGPLKGVLEYTEEPIVSSDIVGSTRTRAPSTAELTMAMGNLVKVLGWYDNEWGYSNRLVDLIAVRRRPSMR